MLASVLVGDKTLCLPVGSIASLMLSGELRSKTVLPFPKVCTTPKSSSDEGPDSSGIKA